jgi:hypothetical protein
LYASTISSDGSECSGFEVSGRKSPACRFFGFAKSGEKAEELPAMSIRTLIGVCGAVIAVGVSAAWARGTGDGAPAPAPAVKGPIGAAKAAEANQPREIVCPGDEFNRRWLKPMSKIAIAIKLSPGPTPMDCTGSVFDAGVSPPRTASDGCFTEFQWCPTNLFYGPLYFDDTPLERYGQTPCPVLQTTISAAHFFTVFPTLPYRMGIDAPCDRVYTLGYYRPGSPTPCLRQRLPFEWDAALLEAGAWVGGVFALP